MCGIVGIWGSPAKGIPERLKRMNDKLRQRGPDSEGYFFHKQIGLGHRRLSIIDLDSGNQPIFNEDRSVVIVFNGEVYNFVELRAKLIDCGHVFQTLSDTEVIVHGYEEYGINGLLEKIEGMFAFSLYDVKHDVLFVVRDRFGEKPLYYFQIGKELYFASELKAIVDEYPLKEICQIGMNYFLALTYIPAPHTIYKGVKKLLPGHYIRVDHTNTLIQQYYKLTMPLAENCYSDFEHAKSDLRELLTQSVKMRMVSDVPIGTFLSGGVDSSIISAIMSRISSDPIKTFSIGFKEKDYDESARAKVVSAHIGSDHELLILDYKCAESFLDDVIQNFDEPFADASAISTFVIAKLARKKVKVVLTGDCADELFGGYEKYLGMKYQKDFNNLPVLFQKMVELSFRYAPHNEYTSDILRKAKKLLTNRHFDDLTFNYNLMCLGFNDSERKELLQDNFSMAVKDNFTQLYNSVNTTELIEKLLFIDKSIVLEGCMLPKVDRSCMQCSLEARVPFLDSRVVDFANKCPTSYKINNKRKKYILKEAFKGYLPEEVFLFPKHGFGLPVDRWFRYELNSELESLINKTFIEKQNIFRHDILESLFNEHMSKIADHRFKLWTIYVFQKWWKKNFE